MAHRVNQKGFGYVILLLTIVIAGILYVCVAKLYLKPPTENLDQDTKKIMAEQGVKAQNMPGMVQNAQTALDKANEILRQKDRDTQTLLSDGKTNGEGTQER